MWTCKHFLIGLLGVVFFVGVMGSVAFPQNPTPDPCHEIVNCQITDIATDGREKRLFDRHQRRRNLVLKLLENYPPCGPGTRGEEYVVSKDGNSVCDNQTGLWWQQSPSTEQFNWQQAIDHCKDLTLSGKIWRLPTVEEIQWHSLVDYSEPAQADALNTPNGPFVNVEDATYWSATSDADVSMLAWVVSFDGGGVALYNTTEISSFVWCVSGGQDAH